VARILGIASNPTGVNVAGDCQAAALVGGVGDAVKRLFGVLPGRQHADVVDHDQVAAADPADGPATDTSALAWPMAAASDSRVNQAARGSYVRLNLVGKTSLAFGFASLSEPASDGNEAVGRTSCIRKPPSRPRVLRPRESGLQKALAARRHRPFTARWGCERCGNRRGRPTGPGHRCSC
jgi:hypothetical protein